MFSVLTTVGLLLLALRLQKAKKNREREDFKAKIEDACPGLIPGLAPSTSKAKTAKASNGAHGKVANAASTAGNGRGGSRGPKGSPPSTSKDDWQVESRKKWGNKEKKTTTKKNSSRQTKTSQKKKTSENALVARILSLLEKKLESKSKKQ